MINGELGLGGIIVRLERENPDRIIPFGWGEAESYRGYYADLAFTPKRNARIGDMLDIARAALGATFHGYKGGDYRMGEWTQCWIAQYGATSSDAIGPLLLECLLALTPEQTAGMGA